MMQVGDTVIQDPWNMGYGRRVQIISIVNGQATVELLEGDRAGKHVTQPIDELKPVDQ